MCEAAGAKIDDLVRRFVFDFGSPQVDWGSRSNVTGPLSIALGDYLFDEVRRGGGLDLSFTEIDVPTRQILEVAKIRYAT